MSILLNIVLNIALTFPLNYESFAAENELVFINFYAQWCRFSAMLGPIFDTAADKIRQEFPQSGKIVMGKVDCDKECEYMCLNYARQGYYLFLLVR